VNGTRQGLDFAIGIHFGQGIKKESSVERRILYRGRSEKGL
jgi:hypothetical protein